MLEAKIGCTCPLVSYLFYVILSLLLYIGEIALHLVAALHVYWLDQVVWFSLLVGLLVVPGLTSQLLSYTWHSTSEDRFHQAIVSMLHALQLGLPWRYGRLIASNRVTHIDKEIAEVSSLRVFLSFASSVPIALLESYIVLNSDSMTDHPVLIVAALAAVCVTSWTLVTYRKRSCDYAYLAAIMTWPGTLLKLLWRLGELGCRVIVLALFAGLRTYWMFLVLSLHWMTMFVWLLVEQLLKNGSKQTHKWIPHVFISSFMYMFSYLNIIDKKSKYRSVVFYCIMFFENLVLLILWIIFDNREYLHIHIPALTGSIYASSMILAIIYYNCFHMKSFQNLKMDQHTAYIHTCINCRLSCCVKHDLRKQRPPPPSEWWASQQGQMVNNKESKAPSEISSASKSKAAVSPPGQFINPAFVYDNRGRRFMDDTFSTVYTDSQYLSEFTVDSPYDTGSEFVWDNYDLKQRRRSAPDLIDAMATPALTPGSALAHQRSDSGFSASLSVHSDLAKNNYTDYSLYTTDDSDFSYDPRYHKARLRAHWRRMSVEALNQMSLNARRFEDPSESDFFSQSSITSYPSSAAPRRAKMYRDRRRLVMGKYSSGVNRTLQKRAERFQMNNTTATSDSDTSVPQRLSPRATVPASNPALSVRATVPDVNPKSSADDTASKMAAGKRVCTQDALEKIIADVSNIEISLSSKHLTAKPQMGITQMTQRKKGRTLRTGGYSTSTDQSVMSDSPSTNSGTSLFSNQQKVAGTKPVWF